MKPAVLVVDDSLTVRMDLDEAFRAASFSTVLCATAAAAREALARASFALVVLDVLLPDSDGIEFLKEIKGLPSTAGVPILLLSTEAEVRDRVRGLSTGADEYVGKPYERSYVVARARELARRVFPEMRDRPVLVIDDSETHRARLQSALEERGYSVATAARGEEGLGLAASLRPRAAIVDGVLPDLDGATIIRRLRQDVSLRNTPCILLTASEDPGGELRAYDFGADAYVRKTDDVEMVLARLAALLRSASDTVDADAPSGLLGPKRILAVDDSATYLHKLADQLRGEGYEPILARSGEEALEMLAAQPVDCILLDLVMPGLSGSETCRRIRKSPAWHDLPIIILTAREERDSMLDGINAGADDYIVKAGEFDVLKARVRAQIRRKQFEDEGRRIRDQLLKKEMEAAEARASRELAETRARLLEDLERKNQELEAFTYSVSHDLRAPLRAISGFSRILLEEHATRLDPEGRRVLNVVLTSVGRMGELIDDMLEFSRIGRTALQLSTVDMTALAREVVDGALLACPEREIRIRLDPLPPARGDRSLLRQVWVNLVGNAVKYTRPTREPRIEIDAREDGERIVYSVADNGVGFDMAYAHKLFGVFQRLHPPEEFEGTGVGLAIVERVVRRHGGQVEAEGALGRGAVFRFSLPKGGIEHESR